MSARPKRPVMIPPEVVTDLALSLPAVGAGRSGAAGAQGAARAVVAAPLAAMPGAAQTGALPVLPVLPGAVPPADPSRRRMARDLPPVMDRLGAAAPVLSGAQGAAGLPRQPGAAPLRRAAAPAPAIAVGTGAPVPLPLPEAPARLTVAEAELRAEAEAPPVPGSGGFERFDAPGAIARSPSPPDIAVGLSPAETPEGPGAAPTIAGIAIATEAPQIASGPVAEADAHSGQFGVSAQPARAPGLPAVAGPSVKALARPSVLPPRAEDGPGLAILLVGEGLEGDALPDWAAGLVTRVESAPEASTQMTVLPFIAADADAAALSRIAMMLAQRPTIPALYVDGEPETVRDLIGLARVSGRALVLAPEAALLAGAAREAGVAVVHAFPPEPLAQRLARGWRFAERDGAAILAVEDSREARAAIGDWFAAAGAVPVSLAQAMARLSR